MKKILITVVVLVVVIISWTLLRNKKSGNEFLLDTPTPIVLPILDSTNSPQATPLVSPLISPVISKNIVTYTDSGYTPNTITIKKGESVVWKNESKFSMWTASAVHPTHKAYPDTDISLCGAQTLVAISMFDACKGIEPGQSWSFKFDNVGTWGYHNHSNSSHWGKVVVE